MHDTNHAPVQFVRKLPLSKISEQEPAILQVVHQ